MEENSCPLTNQENDKQQYKENRSSITMNMARKAPVLAKFSVKKPAFYFDKNVVHALYFDKKAYNK